MSVDTSNRFTMHDVCSEQDPNLVDAVLQFYNRAKEAKEAKISGQMVFHMKDGTFETWSLPRTGRIRKGG